MSGLVPLKRCARVTYGLGQPPVLSDDGVPIIRATNIFRGRIVPEGLIRAGVDDLPTDRAPLLSAGEVLVVRSGAYTGDSAIVTPEWAGAAPGYDLRATPNRGIEPRFLAYSLLGMLAMDAMMIARTRAAQPHLNAEDLSEVPIWECSVESQQAIADFLDAETACLDALIAKKRRMVELLEGERMSVMHAGVSGRFTSEAFRSSSLAWLDEVGAGWTEVKLTRVAALGSGHTPSRNHPEWWTNCTVPWVTTGEVAQMRSDRIEVIENTREMISEVGVANSSATIHPAGTVVLCRTAASAGYSAIMGSDMATSQDLATWTCGPLVRPRFLLLCLRAMRQDLLGRLAMGSTHRTIYMPDIESIRVPLPEIDEQDRIIDRVWAHLDRLDRTADAIGRQIDLLTEKRRALITAAVTGELDVPGVAA